MKATLKFVILNIDSRYIEHEPERYNKAQYSLDTIHTTIQETMEY
jgi:hypothetical protein